jgi:hypothetical protein
MNALRMMVIAMLLVSVSACSQGITQENAEQIAHEFVAKNVKFFTREENSSSLVGEVNVPTATSYLENGVWVVAIHVSSMVEGVEKKNDLIVKVDRKGNVVEFNGQKLEKA